MSKKLKVHAWGSVARSNNDDTDCGAATNATTIVYADAKNPLSVTCKRCLKIREQREKLKSDLKRNWML